MKNRLLLLLSLLLLNLSAVADQVETPANRAEKQDLLESPKRKYEKKPARKPSIKSMSIGAAKAIEAIKQDPLSVNSVWDQEFFRRDPEMRDLMIKFKNNDYGLKSKNLRLVGMTKDDIISKLLSEDFHKRENPEQSKDLASKGGLAAEKTITKKVKHRKSKDDSGEIYVHKDGSIIRIKDASIKRKYRPQAYVTKAVMRDIAGSVLWDNEAFKVTNEGYAVPKAPNQKYGFKLSPNDSSGEDENKGWVDLIMEETHLEIVN